MGKHVLVKQGGICTQPISQATDHLFLLLTRRYALKAESFVCMVCVVHVKLAHPNSSHTSHAWNTHAPAGSSRCCNVGRLSTCAASVAYNFIFVYIIHYRNVSALQLDACMQHTTQRHSGAGYSDHRTQTVVEIIYTSRSRNVSVERLAVGGVWITLFGSVVVTSFGNIHIAYRVSEHARVAHTRQAM